MLIILWGDFPWEQSSRSHRTSRLCLIWTHTTSLHSSVNVPYIMCLEVIWKATTLSCLCCCWLRPESLDPWAEGLTLGCLWGSVCGCADDPSEPLLSLMRSAISELIVMLGRRAGRKGVGWRGGRCSGSRRLALSDLGWFLPSVCFALLRLSFSDCMPALMSCYTTCIFAKENVKGNAGLPRCPWDCFLGLTLFVRTLKQSSQKRRCMFSHDDRAVGVAV